MSPWLNPRSASACSCARALVSCRSAGKMREQLARSEHQLQAFHCDVPEKGLGKLLVMVTQAQAGALRILQDGAIRARRIAPSAYCGTGTHVLGKLYHGCALEAVEGFQARCFVAGAH